MSGNNNNTNNIIGGRAKVAPALDPRNAILGQPFKRLVDEGFVTELMVKFTPNGYSASGKPDQRLAGVEASGLTAGIDAPVGMLLAASDKGNLIPKAGKSKNGKAAEQPKSKKTLVLDDFKLDAAAFIARASVVANEVGGSTLIGRVRSADALGNKHKATISYQDWWKTATVSQRAVSLCQKKIYDQLDKDNLAKMRNLQCPFRGNAEFVIASEEYTTPTTSAAGPSTPPK